MNEAIKFKLRRLIATATDVINLECTIKDGLDSPYYELACSLDSLEQENLDCLKETK